MEDARRKKKPLLRHISYITTVVKVQFKCQYMAGAGAGAGDEIMDKSLSRSRKINNFGSATLVSVQSICGTVKHVGSSVRGIAPSKFSLCLDDRE